MKSIKNYKLTLLGTLAYTLVTFPLAIVWHVMLFEGPYRLFGYFEGEPSFILGLVTIIIQGFVLSLFYSSVAFTGKPIVRGLKYALLMGVFFWTSHVLAFVAKQVVVSSLLFIVMESLYLLIQFGLFGIIIGLLGARFARN